MLEVLTVEKESCCGKHMSRTTTKILILILVSYSNSTTSRAKINLLFWLFFSSGLGCCWNESTICNITLPKVYTCTWRNTDCHLYLNDWNWIPLMHLYRLVTIQTLKAQDVCSLCGRMEKWLIFHIGNA